MDAGDAIGRHSVGFRIGHGLDLDRRGAFHGDLGRLHLGVKRLHLRCHSIQTLDPRGNVFSGRSEHPIREEHRAGRQIGHDLKGDIGSKGILAGVVNHQVLIIDLLLFPFAQGIGAGKAVFLNIGDLY